MNSDQRVLVNIWIGVLVTICLVTYFQGGPVWGRLVFLPLVVYCIINRKIFSAFPKQLRPVDVLEAKPIFKIFAIAVLGIEILVAYTAIIKGVNPF